MSAKTVAAPDLPYRPRDPRSYMPAIALVGCGDITKHHLAAYRAAGYRVTALCDLDETRARERGEQYFPDAEIFTDYRDVLRRDVLGEDGVEVVDVATHPPGRPAIIEACLRAGKHVLSQKPFVLDLDVGRRLADLADASGVRLAVNQNGRWAPYFSYIREAIHAGLIGEPTSLHFAVYWDHNGVAGSEFENVRHLILYDFAIHWFDILTCYMQGRAPTRVFASFTRSPSQEVRPALLAQVMVEYEDAQASLIFDGDTRHGPLETVYIAGSKGTITSSGPSSRIQTVTLHTNAGKATPKLAGCWFPDGFHGTMGELLRAVEEDRQPSNSGRENLASLALCFAAVASAELGEPVRPLSVTRLPEG